MTVSTKHDFKRILVIRMRYIGDTILVTPLLRSLRAAMPLARISFLVNRQSVAILRNHPDIDEVIGFDERTKLNPFAFLKFLWSIRRLKADLVIDLTRNDRSALVTFISGAVVRLGYEGARGFVRKTYTREVPNRFGGVHTVDHHLDMAVALNIPLADANPTLVVSPEDSLAVQSLLKHHGIDPSQPLVILHPGARRWYKSWPVERFARVADALMTQYPVQVVLSGAVEDRKACSAIKSAMTCKPMDLSGLVPLHQLPALLRAGTLFIGNDSAPIHVATAVNTPVIALFGPTRWEDWQPRRAHDRTLGIAFPCRPCGHSRPDCPLGQDYCMKQISYEAVWVAVEERFAALGIRRRSPT